MAERKDGTKRKKVERPDLPVEFYLSLPIEDAAKRMKRPESTVRNMIKSGELSVENGYLVEMGTGKKNKSYNVSRKGLEYLAKSKIFIVDYKTIVKMTIDEIKREGAA